MVSFRRWITALAVLALFAGLASAQINSSSAGTGSLQCNATVAVPPQLRAEGLTELIGDVVLTCTGGAPLAPGTIVPTANITVSLLTNVTSRILSGSSTGPSEALLLIDEPGAANTTATGPGTLLPQRLCSTPSVGAGAGGCVQMVGANGQACDFVATGVCANTAINMFQGNVNGNQVTFQGVPILAPASAGVARVFRITNVRANVSPLNAGLAGTTPLTAYISISGSTSLPINNPSQTVGFIQTGLNAGLRNIRNDSDSSSGGSIAQCAGATTTAVTLLRYTENFGTAFKTRVAPTASYNGQAGPGTAIQNIPGAIYNSESGFISPAGPSGNGWTSGLADYGTRLKATFNNVPAGVSIFVSTTSVFNTNSATAPLPPGTSTSAYAVLVTSETAQDGNGFVPSPGFTNQINGSTPITNIFQVPVVNGTATAVWEVTNSNPSLNESLYFGVWVSASANTPPVGAASVTLSYAPTPPAGQASAWATASGSLVLPRFTDQAATTVSNAFTIAGCNTVLLYPFVTNQGGFDTGLAIANTTTDPFGTRTQHGTCTLNFYGAATPSGPFTTPDIPTGTVYANLASSVATGFQGYVIAVCQFQLAHGFAFISDLGAQKLAMGYLAVVLPTGTGARNSGSLANGPGNAANTSGGSVEAGAH